MTTTPHTDCHHPSTKAARAKCRKARAAAQVPTSPSLRDLIASYYAGADLEEIAAQVPRDLAEGYYNNTLDAEEFIAHLQDAANGVEAPAAPEGCTHTPRPHRILRTITPGTPTKAPVTEWVMVCTECAIAHTEAKLAKVDGNTAFAQNGGERTKLNTLLHRLNELRG